MPSGHARPLPERLSALRELALDLFWTWSHAGDAMWRTLDPDLWERTGNPWFILQYLPKDRLEALAKDKAFLKLLDDLTEERRQYQERPSWFGQLPKDQPKPHGIAYFSMEFGLSEALPLYAGGLGILAGDYLKASSDLGIPLVGVGLLYQEGYFRQYIDGHGQQAETYPYNEPASLPIEPVMVDGGTRLRIKLDLPGRQLSLRVWQATVGRVTLYLLDSNDLLNSAADRGITAKLYGGGSEMRFLQELVLGIGGWRVLEAMGIDVDVCHLNEGHAALVVLARALSVMARTGLSFWPAFWAARAGNIFTTHTPVSAGFDRFLLEQLPFPAHFIQDYLSRYGVNPDRILALGRQDPDNDSEPFNMSWLALRGSAHINAVSARHELVSKRLFQPLYPRWPDHEVPVGHVTNGIHTPTWDSQWADALWTDCCGRERWRDSTEGLAENIHCLSDDRLWAFRAHQRADLIENVRFRLDRQLASRPSAQETEVRAALDPNVLTIGFARRFTAYKRPNLLLHDPERLIRLLTAPDRPVQLIVAGKAHPDDKAGKAMVAEWLEFVNRPEVRRHAVFLEDYDIGLAQEMVAGVDLWVNTPRPPMEACGTSGMKVLVNGGLNLSVPDGWWAEAHKPEAGWVLGDHCSTSDAEDAIKLYELLEKEVAPEFYDRHEGGIPQAWVARIRESMATLAPHFSANRMVRDYYDGFYTAASAAYHARLDGGAKKARALHDWEQELTDHWSQIHFGEVTVSEAGEEWDYQVRLYLGELRADQVRVELYAAPMEDKPTFRQTMKRSDTAPGAEHGYVYSLRVPTDRPAAAYTARVIPFHEDAFIPAEQHLIRWQK
ncbi:alpha-glucan family phosphorylase [Kordiimonas marina]|uniref:alpha-glucan family phosphorylase n=1 Tax=Kordiimonas marina TaxID=2872312 RepID=UPI001FF3BC2E|nr:alpha-glucan family phosphorylase [Kordiimonas marina]MCJ9429350.1 alpha-glucan family phosphorylase [Kordiimonas marina]